MGKYDPLRDHLASPAGRDHVRPTFDDRFDQHDEWVDLEKAT